MKTETISIKPTWSGLLPALLAVHENAETLEGRRMADTELNRMARLADIAGELVEALTSARDFVEECEGPRAVMLRTKIDSALAKVKS